MLEIRKGTASKNYENTFFREFADNLKKMFDKYSYDGLLIGNPHCKEENRLQIDALLVTPKAVCIIDFKNVGGKITLPSNAKSDFEFCIWTNENGEPIKSGNSINPFFQLKKQKKRFIKVVERHIQAKLPLYGSSFNALHTVKAICFQQPIELVGKIPTKEELNFFIFDKSNYLETIKDIIDISDKEVKLTKESFDLFKEFFKADIYDTSEKYDQVNDLTSYHTQLDFENLYPDQKLALKEIENFIKSEEERIFILQGTSLSGKTHLIPFIKDIAFNNQIREVKLFVLSGRISNNLLKSSNLEFESIYSYIYGSNSTVGNEEEEEEENELSSNLEIVPLLKSDDTEEAIFIVDESHLISDNYHQSFDLIFGSGKLLKDFLEFADLKNSKRKIVFIGDSFQLSFGKKEESSLNPDYLNEKYGLKCKSFQLVDKVNKSIIVTEALKPVNCIRQQSFNTLSFNFSDNIRSLSKEDLKEEIEKSLNTNPNFHILCYSNSDAQQLNYWIKNSILKNGSELTKGDLVIFENNIFVEDENDPFSKPKKIFNGQFGTVVSVSDLITKDMKLLTPLYFRKTQIQLIETNHILSVLSFENFRLSDKGELSNEEIISFNILLNQLTEKEIPNFKSGKYHADEEIKYLIDKYETAKKENKKKTGITKLRKALQKQLRNIPSSDYYKFKNSALLRFGWALTVHKSMSYKWNEIYFNVKTTGGKTNENYFKWIYTGLIRATQKVSLINYEPISPFFKLTINPAVPRIKKGKELFYVADTTADLSNFNKTTSEKFIFPDIENKSSLLQLFKFVENKIAQNNLSINQIDHKNYQELYEIKGRSGEVATISIYYNNKGQFKMPTLMKSTPKKFGEELLNLLKSENQISDFAFIQSNWRRAIYEQLNQQLKSKKIGFGYIIQVPYKDTIQFNNGTEMLVADLYYDGDGFFTSLIPTSCTSIDFWAEIQNLFNQIKGS